MIPVIRERKLVIVESPFGGDVQKNIRYLRACLRDCVLRSESPYASHGLLTQEGVLNDDIHGERELGIHLGFQWHEVADYMVVYTDLGISRGMTEGIKNSGKFGLQVVTRRIMWNDN